jgi:cytochrome c oxidase subunit 2
MSDANQEPLRRVLIASANPLFARGLQKIMTQHWERRGVDVRLAATMQEVTAALETWQPDLVVLDYDDAGSLQREVFLSQFIAGNRPMQVMLVSLRASGEVIVYDRRSLTPDQAEDWLDLPWAPPSHAQNKPERAPFDQEPAPQSVSSPAGHPVSGTYSNLRSGGMKHYLIAGVLTIVLTLVMGFILSSIGLMPVEASAQAVPIDQMISLQVWMISFLFSLITVFIVYSVVVFRRRGGPARSGANRAVAVAAAPTAPAALMKGSNRLEVAWTIVPLFTVVFLSFLGARDLSEVRKADPGALEVKVTAFQWGWSYQYTDSGVITSTLVLPVNRQVRLLLSSRDVIHSFWVPEFRVKQDVLPGENLVKELRITPNKIGYYKVRCAEMCGLDHASMEGPVMVTTQTGFDDWIAEMAKAAKASGTPAERGQTLAQNNGCFGCHSTDGSKKVGPTWTGLAGSQITLTDGSTITADDAYLHESIVDPNKKIHQGFAPGIMPQTYKSQLTDDQIADIIAYIKSLK